jgi:hypothetical protein
VNDRAAVIAVIDQAGNLHHFDADDWDDTQPGGLRLLKDGKRVASFPHGYIGVYLAEHHK